MATLVTNQAVNVRVGNRQIGPVSLPQGTVTLILRMDADTWPAVSDGTVTVSLEVSRGGGAFVREFSDSFDHVRVVRQGVVQPVVNFTATLAAPFVTGDRLRAQIDSDVAFTTRVTVESN